MQARRDDLCVRIPALFEAACRTLGTSSSSQIKQDLFVIAALNGACGYFVDIGAANGLVMSNTYMLQKVRGWSGVQVEPARCWQEALRRHRLPGALIDDRAARSRSGESVLFTETRDSYLSTLAQFQEHDRHAATRRGRWRGSMRFERCHCSTCSRSTRHRRSLITCLSTPRVLSQFSAFDDWYLGPEI
jgi:hypothetical protein